MNNIRRKQIQEIIDKLEDTKNLLENVMNDEQEYYDNMPENLQGSIRGMEAEEYIDKFNDAIDSIDEALETLSM